MSILAKPALDAGFHPFKAVRAVSRLLADPEDTRQAFAALGALRGRASQRLARRFARTPTGAAVLAERRRLCDALQDRAALARLPAGSLGRQYLAFMQAENLSASGLAEASGLDEQGGLPPDVRLTRERMRDMHDLTHVLTGYGRDPMGELCLLAFMFRQAGNPGMLLIVLMAMRRFPRGKAGRALRAALVEGLRNGGKARWLPEQDWEAMLAQPLDALRARLDIAPPARYRDIRP